MPQSREGYFCPSCGHRLTDDNMRAVRMKGKLEGEHFTVTCPFELPAELGVYGGEAKYPGLQLESGARVEFQCTACSTPFTLPDQPDLAAIHWIMEDGEKRQVVFNQVLGRRMTVVVRPEEGKILELHGAEREDLERSTAELMARLGWRF